ncbi:MAG: PRC-barrel domain-containing protein [Bacillus sp. (in: Bacteria)]|nr:PRC-barrel domain-containing protein [Bacillus sp. (in: firmicutes)]
MLIFTNTIQNFNVQATDDTLGKVKDLYFDEDNWVVRYLVVDTQKWLPGRKVLVSPIGLDKVNYDQKVVQVFASKDQIKDSPTIEEHQAVTRKDEFLLNYHFGWPHYWSYYDTQRIWGGYESPVHLKEAPHSFDNATLTPEQEQDTMLRSVKEIKGDFTGYKIQATDGDIGQVSDFLLDPDTWKLRYFVVDTRNLLPGKFVVLSTDWIEHFDQAEKKVTVDLPKEKIENGPFFELTLPLTRIEEKQIYDAYNKDPYF